MTGTSEPRGDELFAALPLRDDAALERLRGRLAQQAQDEGILGVGYRTLDTPVGSLLLAATEQGLLRIAYETQDHDRVLQQVAEDISPCILRAPARLDEASRQLEEYFTGDRTAFELPLDLRGSTDFRRGVLRHLPDIGFGRTESYAEVAAAVGSPKAVRAVGTACATNPLPIVVPCHRVVRSDGTAGGYVGGADAKHTLLNLEAAA